MTKKEIPYDEFNEKYKAFIHNDTAINEAVGTCDASSKLTKQSVKDGSDSSFLYDYYLCGDYDDKKCYGLTETQWMSTWGNCQQALSSGSYDKCLNMAETADAGGSKPHMNMDTAVLSVIHLMYYQIQVVWGEL